MSKTRYKLTCSFFDTEQQAKAFCEKENSNRYIRKKHPAHYTPWVSDDGSEKKFIAWHYYK